ncbi:MAG: hypothetical protein ACOYL0_12735 [Limnohabitans sp.]|nr:hypothetical protein [Burkholderiales bacterium]
MDMPLAQAALRYPDASELAESVWGVTERAFELVLMPAALLAFTTQL